MCKGVDTLPGSVILEVKNASYAYEGEKEWVWNQLSCKFYAGKIHAVAGESGCGKSSVLYLLNGTIPHMMEGKMEGSVYFDGQDVTGKFPRDRCDKIGLVMQCPENQFCTFTVEEEIAFGMENLSLPQEQMKERIQQTLKYVGMEGYEEYDLNHLSGGQKQKIAIASILVMEPNILLLDEPTANLDPRSRKEILELIVRLSREQKRTIILVEHNLEEIKEDVDYLYIMNRQGELNVNGTWEDLPSGRFRKKNVHGSSTENTDAEVVLDISSLKFAYPGLAKNQISDKKWILKGIDLTIFRQDFLAVVGENGAGKSTLLQIIFQIMKQNEGTIQLYEKPIEEYKKKELYRKLGLVFQNPENQFVTNSVMDELMFSLRKERLDRKEKEEKVLRVLRQFNLEEHKDKSPFVLSQGQKRRLSVATMLLTEQKILFLDEPTYGQDFENRHELMRDMQELNKKGTTIIMITHDLDLVAEYASRVVEIQDGKVSFDSSQVKYDKEAQKGGNHLICLHT